MFNIVLYIFITIAPFKKILSASFAAEAIQATNAIHGHPLKRTHYKILFALNYLTGPASIWYIWELTRLTRPYILPHASDLQKADMITQENDPKTGRPWFTITPKGVETLHILERNIPSKPPKHWQKFREYSQIRLLKQQLNKKT